MLEGAITKHKALSDIKSVLRWREENALVLAQTHFPKELSVKRKTEPQRAGRAAEPMAAGWSCDLLPETTSVEMKLVYGGFLCLEASLSPALNISLNVFLNFSDVQKLSEII